MAENAGPNKEMEMLKKLKKQVSSQLDLIVEFENYLQKADEPESSKLEEKSGYTGDYMPDYILDENGFIVDVIPGSVKVSASVGKRRRQRKK